jgi:hypothetical protein
LPAQQQRREAEVLPLLAATEGLPLQEGDLLKLADGRADLDMSWLTAAQLAADEANHS